MGSFGDVSYAYLAGLLDGEGCFCIWNRFDDKYTCEISVGMTTPEPLQVLREKFGGHLSHQSRQKDTWARRWTWKISDTKTVYLLCQALLPHSIVKRKQIETMIEFCEARLSKPRTKKISPEIRSAYEIAHGKMTVLNKKGVDYALTI